MENTSQVIFRVEGEIKKLFRVTLAKNGDSAQDVLEKAVKEYIDRSHETERIRAGNTQIDTRLFSAPNAVTHEELEAQA